MLQGQVHCPNCDKDVFAVVQPSTDGDALAGGSGRMRMVRKCAECRLPLPADAAPAASAMSTAPEASMPVAAVIAPEQPAPVQRRANMRRLPQPQAAPVQAVAAPLLVPSHDYAAMMREELAALDAAEQQIRERRVYLQRMIAMLEPQAEAAEEAA